MKDHDTLAGSSQHGTQRAGDGDKWLSWIELRVAMQTRESGSESRNPYKSQARQHTSAITILWELETGGSLHLQTRQPLSETQFKLKKKGGLKNDEKQLRNTWDINLWPPRPHMCTWTCAPTCVTHIQVMLKYNRSARKKDKHGVSHIGLLSVKAECWVSDQEWLSGGQSCDKGQADRKCSKETLLSNSHRGGAAFWEKRALQMHQRHK